MLVRVLKLWTARPTVPTGTRGHLWGDKQTDMTDNKKETKGVVLKPNSIPFGQTNLHTVRFTKGQTHGRQKEYLPLTLSMGHNTIK